jgi:hypothetical protein
MNSCFAWSVDVVGFLFSFVVGSLAADMNKLNKDVRDSSQVLVTPTHDLFSIPPRCLLRLAMS